MEVREHLELMAKAKAGARQEWEREQRRESERARACAPVTERARARESARDRVRSCLGGVPQKAGAHVAARRHQVHLPRGRSGGDAAALGRSSGRSSNEIARRAGVTWGAIQRHCGTREQLALESLARQAPASLPSRLRVLTERPHRTRRNR